MNYWRLGNVVIKALSCRSFNMRLYGLLLTFLVLADDNYGNTDICDHCFQHLPNDGNHSNSSLFTPQCFLYNLKVLSCSWSTDSLPVDAHYSASYQFCSESNGHPLNCTLDSSKKLVECQSQITMPNLKEVAFNFSISMNGNSDTVCKFYELEKIEKLDPPRNITALVHSGTLEIQWVRPESCCSIKEACFIYELKINNEIKNVKNDLVYKYANIKPTSCYTIQIRTKHYVCVSNNDIWSDWSQAVVIGPEISSTPALNASVIICIALVLPMILLAIILVCKLQRLPEKVFPSIPNPSKKVQIFLENDDFDQVTPKQIEETAEILEVSG